MPEGERKTARRFRNLLHHLSFQGSSDLEYVRKSSLNEISCFSLYIAFQDKEAVTSMTREATFLSSFSNPLGMTWCERRLQGKSRL